MGVIKQEGIRQSIITYIGVLIGTVNTMYIYPQFFEPEELGLFRFLIDSSALLLPFISLGISNLSVKMFPVFRNKENGHNGLLFFLMFGVVLGYLFFLLLFFIAKPVLDLQFVGKSQLIIENWSNVIPLAGLMILASICYSYVLNFKKTAMSAVFNDLYLKIGLPVIAVTIYYDIVSIKLGIYLLLGIYSLVLLSFLIYIYIIKEWHWKPNWSFLNPALGKEMRIYALYGVLGSIGGILATRIDVLMVAMLATNDLKDVGVYSIAMFIANIIMVPAKAINSIASPLISQSWKDQDINNIEDIYSKSSIVLLTLGIFFLIGIWCSVDDLFRLMPKGEIFAQGKYVILILGIGKLFDLATGVNSQIIAFSKFFRFNFYAVLILAVINVISNFIFIPIYQINGAALATMSSLIIFNFSKYLFIHRKLKIQPFSMNTLKVLLIGLLVLIIGQSVPALGIPLVDILIRSTIISILFITSIIYFQISPDLNTLFWQVLDRVKKIMN